MIPAEMRKLKSRHKKLKKHAQNFHTTYTVNYYNYQKTTMCIFCQCVCITTLLHNTVYITEISNKLEGTDDETNVHTYELTYTINNV